MVKKELPKWKDLKCECGNKFETEEVKVCECGNGLMGEKTSLMVAKMIDKWEDRARKDKLSDTLKLIDDRIEKLKEGHTIHVKFSHPDVYKNLSGGIEELTKLRGELIKK